MKQDTRLRHSLPPLEDGAAPPSSADAQIGSNVEQDAFEANVRAAKEYIAAGDAFQIVLSQRLSRRTHATPFTIYRALRGSNPSPYMFYLKFGDDFTTNLATTLGVGAQRTPWPDFNDDEVSGLVEQYSSPEWLDGR